MRLSDIIFLGGSQSRASVKIRCVEIAKRLGCAYITDVGGVEDIPSRYKVFICVKLGSQSTGTGVTWPIEELELLSRRGRVIWDVIDEMPPALYDGVDIYLTSTRFVADIFSNLAPDVAVISHYHCNYERLPIDAKLRKVGWIGHPHWKPHFGRIRPKVILTKNMTDFEVADAYKKIGIALNLRGPGQGVRFHRMINTGIKLINCIGFGIPSISDDEPAYRELPEGCTVFSNGSDWPHKLIDLKADEQCYLQMQRTCLEHSECYHINSILAKYRSFIKAL